MRRAVIALFCILGTTGCWLSHERGSDPEVLDGPRIASSASLAIDGSSVYWADPGRGGIVRVARRGGPIQVIATASPALYTPVAVTATDLVWVERRDGIEVRRIPLDAAGVSAGILVGDGNGGPIGVAADGEHAWFSRDGGTFDLIEVELATGNERVVSTEIAALGLVIDGDDLIGTSCTGEVWRVARDTGVRTAITAAYCPITLSLDEGDVYFTDYAEPMNPGVGGLGIFRAPAAGGVAIRITLADSLGFAVHRGLVYAARDGAIVQIARDGSSIELADAEDVRGVAVDDDFVYWTFGTDGGGLDLGLAPLP